MHHQKLKSAVTTHSAVAYSSQEEMRDGILADPKGYSEEEAEEIIAAIAKQAEVQSKPAKPAKEEKTAAPGKFVYPEYDEYRINVTSLKRENEKGPARYQFTAVKKLRPKVKIEHNVAELLNKQSHNSGKRFYPADTITMDNNEEIVEVE